MELGQGRVRLGVRERVCTQRVLGHWDRLPRAVVTALSLQSTRSVWTMLSDTWSKFWVVLCGAKNWT